MQLTIKGTVFVCNRIDVTKIPDLIGSKRLIQEGQINAAVFVHSPAKEQEDIGEALVAAFTDLVESSDANDSSDDDSLRIPEIKVVRFTKFPKRDFLAALKEHDHVVLLGNDRMLTPAELSSVREPIQAFLDSKGTLIVDHQVAPSLSRHVQGVQPNQNVRGLDLMLGACLECEGDNESSKTKADAKWTAERGFQVSVRKGTVFRLTGRKAVCAEGSATFRVPAQGDWPEYSETLKDRESAGRDFYSAMFDLTQWHRMAIDRTLPVFPPRQPVKPYVADGTLLIVGGGGMPNGLMEKMVELAGGKDAKMVYVPCSESDDVGERHRVVSQWKRMGVKSATFIHTKDRNKANDDESFFEPLVDATGVWFGGGRQWNFSDSYYGTKTHELMKRVLERGGVIGGSSAGASIQGRYLARATPVGNTRIMAPGYERGGLGFLGGVAIDQHFSQRKRQKDMSQLKQAHPQLLGIGIDEATAIIVNGSEAEVVGRGKVFFYGDVDDGEPEYAALKAGEVFDLVKQQVLESASSELPEPRLP